jgi:hypothetical protein
MPGEKQVGHRPGSNPGAAVHPVSVRLDSARVPPEVAGAQAMVGGSFLGRAHGGLTDGRARGWGKSARCSWSGGERAGREYQYAEMVLCA